MRAFILTFSQPEGFYSIQRAEPGDENRYLIDYKEVEVDPEFFALALLGEIPQPQLQAKLMSLYQTT